ncbi:MAG: hypothetical protein NT090_18825, partial [Acidobacteria bacterium]|nr:hypothetical protein [Acidobacteriota bacterium]
RLNIKHHIGFDSPDVSKVVATLRARAAREIEVHETSTGKRVANLYDPDGSRIEFMENRETGDGVLIPHFSPVARPSGRGRNWGMSTPSPV